MNGSGLSGAVDGQVITAVVASLGSPKQTRIPDPSTLQRANPSLLRLPDIGWLDVVRRGGYQGRNPKTGEPIQVPADRTVVFISDPDLLRRLNGAPPLAQTFASEDDRFMNCLHPDGETDGEERRPVLRHEAVDSAAAIILEALLANGSAQLPNFGSFHVVATENDPPKRVRFVPADELLHRLNA